MPYSKTSDAPANIRKLNGVSLTTAQVNWIANVADNIPKHKVDNPWAVAIAQFKRSFKVEDDKWVKRNTEKKSGFYVEKQQDGTYEIVAVSTVAMPDLEDETFSTKAMDYDIEHAYKEQSFPEFRAFLRKGLGFGKVTKMTRVGIFAVDSGVSYDDPFSIQVCEKMLVDNDGTWKVSRGFRVLEVSGGCPKCGEDILLKMKHMLVGFRCPNCGNVNVTYKGTLKGVQFRKARTFDVTVTDVPAVPFTGVQAFPMMEDLTKELKMDKATIKQKFLDAGVDEELIDARLKDVDEEILKEFNFDAIPDAIALKEFLGDEDTDDTPPADAEDVFEIDEEVLKQLSDTLGAAVLKSVQEVIRDEVRNVLDGLTIDVDGMEGVEVEVKELPGIDQLKEQIQGLTEAVESLLDKEENRLKQMLEDAPRNGKLRIRRFKMPENEDLEDEEDEDTIEEKDLEGVVIGGDGSKYQTMTEMVIGS